MYRSIHQPSTTTFYSFDKVMFISEGRVLYFDAPSNFLGYLSQVGYTLPKAIGCNGELETLAYNPAEYAMELLLSVTPQDGDIDAISNDHSDSPSVVLLLLLVVVVFSRE